MATSDPDPLIVALAQAIADGRPVQWPDTDASADETTGPILEELRVLAALADVHRSPADAGTTDVGAGIDHWGPFQVLEPLGRGAFGTVYRARDPRLDREIALKLITPAAAGAERSSLVVGEGRLLAKLRHPNIVTVFGADVHDEIAGVWMELLTGRTLKEELASRGPFSAREAALIGIELTRALAAVHKAGVLHRDIKAQNVMREAGGRIVLTDFGAGRDVRQAADGAIAVAGTPLYMAPELFASVTQNYATDVGANPAAFDAKRFLGRLDGDAFTPSVDCSDVSSMVSTLSAIVGSALCQFVVDGDPTNPVRMIGSNTWTNEEFTIHEFAVRGAKNQMRIWDACLQLSGDDQIRAIGPPTIVLAPVDLSRSRYTSAFLANPPKKFDDIIFRTHLVRPISTLPTDMQPVKLDARLNAVAATHGFSAWPVPQETGLLKPGFEIPAFDGWTLVERPPGLTDDLRKGFDRVIRVLWRGSTLVSRDWFLAAEIYVCGSTRAARLRLIAVLGGFKRTKLKKGTPIWEREVLFETPDRSAIAGSFRNAVLVVRRASVDSEIARDIPRFRDGLFRTLSRAAD